MLNTEAKNWYRDDYMISTEPLLIQVDEVNAVLSSDLMWWAQGLPRDQMKKALHNSLCFGLYALPQSTAEIAGKSDGGPGLFSLSLLMLPFLPTPEPLSKLIEYLKCRPW